MAPASQRQSPACHQAAKPKDGADQGQWRLHGEAVLVGRLPLGEQRAVVELQPGGLLAEADVDRRRR